MTGFPSQGHADCVAVCALPHLPADTQARPSALVGHSLPGGCSCNLVFAIYWVVLRGLQGLLLLLLLLLLLVVVVVVAALVVV